AIAAPWHVLAALANPPQMAADGTKLGFLWFYFVNEQFLRYIGKRVPPGYDTVPLLIFWALTILWVAPWMVFLLSALKRVPLKIRQWREQMSRKQQMSLFFLIWAVVIVGFFTFSTRQEYYTIPAVPALALLIGGWLDKESAAPEAEGRGGRIAS